MTKKQNIRMFVYMQKSRAKNRNDGEKRHKYLDNNIFIINFAARKCYWENLINNINITN